MSDVEMNAAADAASPAPAVTPAPATASARVAPPANNADGPVPSCTVPGLNVWGPGWLADPLQLSFEFDNVVAVMDPLPEVLRVLQGDGAELAPVLHGTGKLSGALLVSLPKGVTRVPHKGIRLTLKTTLMSLQTLARDEYVLSSDEKLLSETEGNVTAHLKLPFEFDIDGLELPESFLGSSFFIRHEISCVVSRPWYTFPVRTLMDVLLLRRISSPMSSAGAEAASRTAVVASKTPTTEVAAELTVGGLSFRLECDNASADGVLPGGVFTGMLTVKEVPKPQEPAEGEGAEAVTEPKLYALLQRVETLRERKGADVAPQEGAFDAQHSGSTVHVHVAEKCLGKVVAPGTHAVRFSLQPEAPTKQPVTPAGKQTSPAEKPPPLIAVLPPPLPKTDFVHPADKGEYSAQYVLRLMARPSVGPGSGDDPTDDDKRLHALSEPMALKIFK